MVHDVPQPIPCRLLLCIPYRAFKCQINIRDSLIRAKVPPPTYERQKRNQKGLTKFGKECPGCPYVKEGRNIQIDQITTWRVNRQHNFSMFYAVLMIQCEKDIWSLLVPHILCLKTRSGNNFDYWERQVLYNILVL